MDKQQLKSIEKYREIFDQKKSPNDLVDRQGIEKNVELIIFQDILKRLELKKRRKVLDIGCGAGNISQWLIEESSRFNCEMHFLDFDFVIEKLEAAVKKREKLYFHSGVFPYQIPSLKNQADFDCIMAYSVLHYTDEPYQFVLQAAQKLAPQGILFVGDIPNVNKKGRFLASDFGRNFDANYKGVSVESLPHFKSQEDYIASRPGQNLNINDELLFKIFRDLRARGFDVYIKEQPKQLPYSYTREDLIIKKC